MTRIALGDSWMPAPTSAKVSACSSTLTVNPCRIRQSAAHSPPMPPPATQMWTRPFTGRGGSNAGGNRQ